MVLDRLKCILSLFFQTKEVFTEMEEKYGEVEEMNVCDNLGDHLVGNVYVKVCVCFEQVELIHIRLFESIVFIFHFVVKV